MCTLGAFVEPRYYARASWSLPPFDFKHAEGRCAQSDELLLVFSGVWPVLAETSPPAGAPKRGKRPCRIFEAGTRGHQKGTSARAAPTSASDYFTDRDPGVDQLGNVP